MRRTLSLSLAAVILLTLAGCGGGAKPAKAPVPSAPATAAPTPTPAATPAPAPKLDAITVKIGSTEKAALKNLPMFVTGIAEQAGVKVEYVEFKGGAEVTKALVTGDIDMAFTVVDNVFKDKSGEFRLLTMVTNGPGGALIVDSQSKESIKTIQDLKGKTIGVSSLGSGPHTTLLELLAANGMDPKSINVLPVGLDPRTVLGTGKVQAMMTIEPYITIVEKSGSGIILVDARKPDGIKAIYKTANVPWIGLISTSGYLQKNGEAAQRVVNTVVKSLKFIASSSATDLSAKVPSFFKDEVKGDEALFTKMLQDNKAYFSADGQLNQEGLSGVWKRLQNSGAVAKDKELDLTKYAESKFLANAK